MDGVLVGIAVGSLVGDKVVCVVDEVASVGEAEGNIVGAFVE